METFLHFIVLGFTCRSSILPSSAVSITEHLAKDGIIKNLKHLKVYSFPYEGYTANINSVKSYYKHNMELLKPEVWKELFFNNGYIYTRSRDQSSAKYLKSSSVKNSLIANGCVIAGNVENSILFRGVKVHEGVVVRNSIIMQNCEIEKNAVLEHIILDKDSRVTSGRHLEGSEGYPVVIEKKVVI
jgi:glucose-1-phosphate adenylyltransferase